jgi:hypothetical protein
MYLPINNRDGRKASRGMAIAFERLFRAQRIRMKFITDNGMNRSPRIVTIQAWAGLTAMVI